MKSMSNKVNLIGHLGFNPEIKNLNNGRKLAKVSIATNDNFKTTEGERVNQTQWHSLVAFGKTAELFERFTRVGTRIAVDGKLMNRNFIDKAGQKRTVTEVHVNEIMILNNWGGEYTTQE
ncbi:MAG: single-stranded DNA-binding protein [Bacteroidota bacterium]|jgi:single-strand DNA-binding protein